MTGGTDTDTGQGDLFSMIDLGDWDNLPTIAMKRYQESRTSRMG